MGALRESSIRADPGRIGNKKELETILPPIINKAVFRLGRRDTMEAKIVRVLSDLNLSICCQMTIIFDLHCPGPDHRFETHQTLKPNHARKVWMLFHAYKR